MHHNIKKMTKTAACLTLLFLNVGLTSAGPLPQTSQQIQNPKTAAQPQNKESNTQKLELTPKQSQALAIRKKISQTAKLNNANAQPHDGATVNNLPLLSNKLKTRLQSFHNQTLSVFQKRGGETKLIDTYELTQDQNLQIKAKSLKHPKQQLGVSGEMAKLMQSFLSDTSLINRMLDIKALPVAMADKEKVAQRVQLSPKSDFKKLLGFSNGYAKFDAAGNLLSVELLTAKFGYQIYAFAPTAKIETPRMNK